MHYLGLPTAHHDAIDVSNYNSRVYECIVKNGYSTIVDAFSGGGRDIAHFRNVLQGKGSFVAIDCDTVRISDMLQKPNFVEVKNSDELAAVFDRSDIAVVQGNFPDKPFGNTGVDLKGQVDLVYCNAGIMFIKPQDLRPTLQFMKAMIKPSGQMILRYSLEREDKKDALGKSYFVHAPELVTEILQEGGFTVERKEDLPDSTGRNFKWLDLNVVKV